MLSRSSSQQILTFKAIVIGNSGVGKSSLVYRYCENKFERNYLATIGIDWQYKIIEIDNQKIKLQIWDTAGQERFASICGTLFKGGYFGFVKFVKAQGIIMTYSLIDPSSLSSIQSWLNIVSENIPDEIPIVLVGTKQDLAEIESEENVQITEIEEIKNKFGLNNSIETSAKTGENIDNAFLILARNIYKNYQRPSDNLSQITVEANEPRLSIAIQPNRKSHSLSQKTKQKIKKCC